MNRAKLDSYGVGQPISEPPHNFETREKNQNETRNIQNKQSTKPVNSLTVNQ